MLISNGGITCAYRIALAEGSKFSGNLDSRFCKNKLNTFLQIPQIGFMFEGGNRAIVSQLRVYFENFGPRIYSKQFCEIQTNLCRSSTFRRTCIVPRCSTDIYLMFLYSHQPKINFLSLMFFFSCCIRVTP